MKKSELFFSALQVPIDYLMVVLAGITVYYWRFSPKMLARYPMPSSEIIPRGQYARAVLVVGIFFVLMYAIDGLYRIKSTKKFLRQIYQVFRATAIVVMFIIILFFLNREVFSSRFIILAGGGLVFVFVSLGRVASGLFQQYLLKKKGIGRHRLLLIGVNNFCSNIKKQTDHKPSLGYKVVGHLETIDLERIERIKQIKGVDEIIECSPNIDKHKLMELKEYCIRHRIVFKYLPTTLQASNFDVNIFLGEPLIEIKNTPLDGWGKIIKRIFDIVGAIVGIIIFGPIMLLAALATWLDSGRPIIFKNERVGHKGRFDLYKFRYMKNKYCHGKQYSPEHNRKALRYLEKLIAKQSIKKGPLYKIKDDPRKTRVGAFLEKYSIDELPQFFNVLKGEMSLVGPRPHQPLEVKKYQDYAKRVLTIKPGITGMAQVSGRSDLSFEDEVRLDIFYIENWSLWGDIKIILKTIPALFGRRRN
jgi:exopolysaccharide biosynthesis polyprenyl glycosylphosphotransferase